MKKILSVILTISMLIGTATGLSGCKKTEADDALTRAAWINILAQKYNLTESNSQEPLFTDVKSSSPYFQEIQSCVEWKIIDKSSEFKPDDNATNGFAAISAIKAIGIPRLEKSNYKVSLKTDAEILGFFKTQSGISFTDDKTLTKTQADEIVQKAQAIAEGLILPKVYEVAYKDNVKQMDLNQVIFSADGKSATLKNGSVNVGDVIVIQPSKLLPDGKYVKVTANSNGALTYTDAEIKEICDSYEISGTYEPNILSVKPLSSGVTVQSVGGTPTALNQRNYISTLNKRIPLARKFNATTAIPLADTYKQAGSVTLSVDQKIGDGLTVTGTVSINFDKITVDFGDWIDLPFNPFDNGVRDSYLRIDNTVDATLAVSGNISKTINLASVGVSLYGVIGVYADLALKIGFDGKISVGVKIKTVEEITIPPWSGAKCNVEASDPVVTSHLDAKGYIRPDLCASVKILGHKVAFVGVYSGIEAKVVVDAKLTEKGAESCIDLKAWVPLVIYYGYDLILKKDDKEKEIWNENGSVWKKHLHLEDGIVVDECTRTGDKVDPSLFEGDKGDVPENIDEDLIEATKNINSGDGLTISAFYIALNPNASDKLSVTHIPDGYKESDLVFTSDKPAIVTVDMSGNLSTKVEGTALIRVSTSDGKYEQFCAVYSFITISGEFNPLV